jgi:tetratricopeptide (TPR) repeat protein
VSDARRRKGFRVFLAFAMLAGAAGAWVAGRAVLRDPDVAILLPRPGAEWIRYPHGARAGTRPAVELATLFSGSIELSGAPREASLEWVAFRSAEVRINGREVVLPDDRESWKRKVSVEVADYLRAGANRVEVAVVNDRGPPALWLRLEADGVVAATDPSWTASLAGATWSHAIPAAEPMVATAVDPAIVGLRPARALAERAAILALWAAIALVVAIAAEVAAARIRRLPEATQRRALRLGTGAAVALVALAWVALVWNNLPSLSAVDGYDAEGHWEYITFVRDHGRLPQADQGWSMFQPPLYYVLAAWALGAAGATPDEAAAAAILRGLSIPLGVAQLLLLFGALRVLFPGRRAAALAGLTLAAFAPGLLLQFQFVGNDALAATLSSAALVVAMLSLRRDRAPVALSIAVGVLLGLGLLAKATVVPVAAVVVVGLGVAAPLRGRSLGDGLRTAGWTAGALVATCGWHFVGVWRRFGHPFAGNWDPGVLPGWWQDPGYVTPGFFLRWGASLREPFLSAYGALQDGFYTTLWGDGLISGRTGIWIAPPWDWEGMAAAYLLALAPAALVLIGGGALIVRLVRRPEASGWMVVSAGAVSLAALAVWPLRLPVYSVVKAAFVLPAAVALCAFAGAGFEILASRSRALRIVVVVLLGTWLTATYTALWIPREDPTSLSRLAWLEAAGAEGSRGAVARYGEVLRRDPAHPLHRLAEARRLEAEGRWEESAAALRALVSDHPSMNRARWRRARLLEQLDRTGEAEAEYRELLSREPTSYGASLGLGRILRSQGEPEEAVAHLRQALVTIPDLAEVHYELGLALEGLGRHEEGAVAIFDAARLDPLSPAILAEWSRVLASGAPWSDPAAAVEVAGRAADLASPDDARLLMRLAESCAAAGDTGAAVEIALRALRAAQGAGDEASVDEIQAWIGRLPVRDVP